MKYIVVGAGSIGQRHFENLKFLKADVQMIPWREIDLNSLIMKLGEIKGQVAIVVSTATNVRLPLINELAKVASALYVEKPIAFRKSDLDLIYTLPQKILRKSIGGFMMRYHPIVKLLLDKQLKDLIFASFEIGHDVNKWRENWKFEDRYASNPDGGGVLLDLCHEIDLAQLLCGTAELKYVKSIDNENFKKVDFESTLFFKNKNGLEYKVSMNYLSKELIRRGSISTKNAKYDFDLVNNSFSERSESGEKKNILHINRNTLFIDIMRDFMLLAEGYETKNPFIPRLDKIKDVCYLIAHAWESREFI